VLFDVWTGLSPREDFGTIRDVGPDFRTYVNQVYAQIADSFGGPPWLPGDTPARLDSTIDSMWAEGWSPANGSTALFVRDFGLILASWLHDSLDGRLLSRGSQEIIHLSVWWQDAGIEAFPGHVIAKRLARNDSGVSVVYFVEGIQSRLPDAKF
jgi:hypothetical protein